VEEACRILEIPREGLHRLSPRQLAQHYRKKALECHPDRGGSHERFIQLGQAYKTLLAGRTPPRRKG